MGTNGKARRNDGRDRSRKPKLPVGKAPTITLPITLRPRSVGSQRPFHTSVNRQCGGCKRVLPGDQFDVLVTADGPT